MTPDSQAFGREAYAEAAPIAPRVAALFYDRLSVLDPALRPLCKRDKAEQGRKLMAMISIAVNNLDTLETIARSVRDRGTRHAGHGFQPGHYDTAAAALPWTLAQGPGADFTRRWKPPESEAYTILATIMQDAAAMQEVAA